jgi:hypothetical protein
MWAAGDPNPVYAEYAALRVSQMKFITEVLRDVQQKLESISENRLNLPEAAWPPECSRPPGTQIRRSSGR